jgi:phosphatidylinositol alpha-1,6-mannosyltransferase
MLKCCLIARNLPPLVGGIENMMAATLRATPDIEWTVIGPAGSRNLIQQPNLRVFELPLNPLLFLALAALLAPYLALHYRFDWVIGSSGGMALNVRWLKALTGARSLIFLHGKDIVTSHWLYRTLFWQSAKAADVISVNSSNTRELAINHGVKPGKVVTIPPCIEEPDPIIESPRPIAKPVIVYSGRIVPRKGLLEWLERSSMWIQANNVEVWIVGDQPLGQLGGTQDSYLSKIHALVTDTNLTSFIKFFGRVTTKEMTQKVSEAKVHIMPLVETPGDIEGFGMVAIEAALLGIPTVAFRVGGVVDAISNAEDLICTEDYDLFNRRLEFHLNQSRHAGSGLARFAQQFTRGPYRQKVLRVLENRG